MNYLERDELDLHLLQLAILAKQHAPQSIGRRLALTKLVHGIMRSGKLCYPQKNQFPAGIYADIYDEARQELLLYICENIDKYDAVRGSVMAWVNVLFERRFFKDAIRKFQTSKNITKISFSEQDYLFVSPEEPPNLGIVLCKCIELDQENIFKHEHIENFPQANFQALAMRRLSGKSWKEISAEFQIKIPTASSFYYRCINKFSKKLRECCDDDIDISEAG
jgi:DNA-directed RNA polymerase specialized sigma24 family protein